MVQLDLSQYEGVNGLSPLPIVKVVQIPRQSASEKQAEFVSEAGSQAQEVSSYAIGSNLVVDLLMAGSMSQIWGMIEGIQVASFVQLFEVKTPGNVQAFLEFFEQITSFEVLPSEEWNNEVFYDVESVPRSLNF